MLEGKTTTPLEEDFKTIKIIAENLPKKDITLIKWQSNGYYPLSEYKYQNGLYEDKYNDTKTSKELAWSIHYNAMTLLREEDSLALNHIQYANSINLNFTQQFDA